MRFEINKSRALRNIVYPALVFVFFGAVFYYLQFSFFYFSDPDTYYHITHSQLIKTEGIEHAVNNFPWLQHTILKDRPGDMWFGYHLLLSLFTLLGDDFFAAKFSAVILAALVFATFFFVLRRFEINYPFLWTLALFGATFYFGSRLLFPRPFVLSIILAILGLYFILSRRRVALFFLSLIYAFSVTEAPLILAMILLWFVVKFIKTRFLDFKTIFSSLGGIALGLLIRPDFPNNLYLIYHGVFSVLGLKFAGAPLNFGIELVYPFFGSIFYNFLFFIGLALVFGYIIIHFIEKRWRKKITAEHLYLFLLILPFAVITFAKSVRFIEYLLPFTLMAAALISKELFEKFLPKLFFDIKAYKNYAIEGTTERVKAIYQKTYRIIRFAIVSLELKTVKITLFSCFLLIVVYYAGLRFIQLDYLWSDYVEVGVYKEAAVWLKENSPHGSLVLNAPWSSFPYLFFYNQQNFYSFGMDPALSYIKNPSLHLLWQNSILKLSACDKTNCQEQENIEPSKIYDILKNKLKGDFIVAEDLYINRDFEEKVADKHEKIEKVFQKGSVKIYKLY